MNIEKLLSYADRKLPDDYIVEISISNKSLSARLEAPSGEGIQFDMSSLYLDNMIYRALQAAEEHASTNKEDLND